jgi:hypothetical protein
MPKKNGFTKKLPAKTNTKIKLISKKMKKMSLQKNCLQNKHGLQKQAKRQTKKILKKRNFKSF